MLQKANTLFTSGVAKPLHSKSKYFELLEDEVVLKNKIKQLEDSLTYHVELVDAARGLRTSFSCERMPRSERIAAHKLANVH